MPPVPPSARTGSGGAVWRWHRVSGRSSPRHRATRASRRWELTMRQAAATRKDGEWRAGNRPRRQGQYRKQSLVGKLPGGRRAGATASPVLRRVDRTGIEWLEWLEYGVFAYGA